MISDSRSVCVVSQIVLPVLRAVSTIQRSRELRMFSRFGQSSYSAQNEGDVHPSIYRLALLLSQFKILGSNARCVAMLTAFKQVLSLSSF